MHSRCFFLSFSVCVASSAAIGPWHHEPWGKPYRDYVAGIRQVLEATATITCATPANSAMPLSTLPPPSPGLSVYHVALGRGTQNYTCPPGVNPSTPPTALGAVATLYNTTCLAGLPNSGPNPTSVAVNVTKYDNSQPIFPLGSASIISGHHYFSNASTPTFNLVWDTTNYGIFFSQKISNVTAPPTAARGPDGSKAVPWLKLEVETPTLPFTIKQKDLVPSVKEIYRVNTAGGAAPATCAGLPTGTVIQKDYAAEYWFYA